MIPPQLQLPDVLFIKVKAKDKRPVEAGWQNGGYKFDDPELIGWIKTSNYGVRCGPRGIVVLDVDELERMDALGILQLLPSTFTIRTGSGGLYKYYICPGISRKIVLEDPETGEHLGELQGPGAFVVGPGSIHPNGKAYEVLEDLAIASLEAVDLLEALQPVMKSKDKKKGAGNNISDQIRIEDVMKPVNPVLDDGDRIEGSNPWHGSETGRNFGISRSKNYWHCFRCDSGGGPLEAIAVSAGLIECRDAQPGCLSDPMLLKAVMLYAEDHGYVQRKDAEKAKDQETKEKTIQRNRRINDWIEAYHFKTAADTGVIYRYEYGVYLQDGEIFLSKLIESEFGNVTTDKFVRDIIGKIKRRTYTDRNQFNSQHVLNVKNGLIDLETLELLPHTPDCPSTAQLDVVYKPEAKALKIEKFLRDVAQSKDIPLIKEIIGWLLWPDYNIHKAVMLLGSGRNGKGTLLRLITAFLGKTNVSNVTLQELVAGRFAKADLYGKLANVGGDLPSKDLSDTASFRNLTGGDDNRAQEKYRPAFSFRNTAKLLFSANVLPRSPDDTYAFYSRWILIEFKNIFDVQKGTGDPDLEAKLTTPDELSGLLNLALEGLARLRSNGWRFSYDLTVDDVEMMYKRNANPVLAFLMDECEAEADGYVEKQVFYYRFAEYAKKHNLRPLTMVKFAELLKDQAEIPISSYRPWRAQGDRPHCWLGVRFKDKEGQSRQSIVLPTPSSPSEENDGIVLEEKEEDRDKENSGLSGLEFTEEEDQALSHTLERMKLGRMLITPFALANMVRQYCAITPTRCRSWLKSRGGRDNMEEVDLRGEATA